MVVYQFLPKEAHISFFEAYGDVPSDILIYAKFLGLFSAISLLWYGGDVQDHDLMRIN